MQISDELKNIFKDIFDDENIEISTDTVAEDIEDWDSLTHIQLMVTISKVFGIKFTTQEITALHNVGDIQKLIEKKLEEKGAV